MLGLDVCLYEVPPHIPEYRPFRMLTKHFHVIVVHILSNSSFSSPYISPLLPPPIYRTDIQSSTLLRSRCPHHLKAFEGEYTTTHVPQEVKYTVYTCVYDVERTALGMIGCLANQIVVSTELLQCRLDILHSNFVGRLKDFELI